MKRSTKSEGKRKRKVKSINGRERNATRFIEAKIRIIKIKWLSIAASLDWLAFSRICSAGAVVYCARKDTVRRDIVTYKLI